MASPSQYRRNGRLAFIPDEDPKYYYKYNKNGAAFKHFCDGWEEARIMHEKQQMDKQKQDQADSRFEDLKDSINDEFLWGDQNIHEILITIVDLIKDIKNGEY